MAKNQHEKEPEARDKIKSHWKDFESLWKAFEKIATHAMSVGAFVYHEWPQGCMYWNSKKVAAFLKRHMFVQPCARTHVRPHLRKRETKVDPSRTSGNSFIRTFTDPEAHFM